MSFPLVVIQYPTGRFGFAGRVPAELAFIADSPDDVTCAIQCGAGLARKIAARNGRKFETRTFASAADALAAAATIGHPVAF